MRRRARLIWRYHPGLALATMLAAAAAYLAFHTPLRQVLAGALGISSRGCYLCARGVAGADLAHALAAMVLVAAAGAAGWAIAARWGPPRHERPLMLGITTIALVTVPAAVVGGLASLTGGSYLRPPAGPLLAALPSFAVLAAARRRGARLATEPRSPLPRTLLLYTVAGCAGGLALAASAVSLLHPPTQGDALTYHIPIAVRIWSDGDLTTMLDHAPREWALAHPGTAELWFGLLRQLGGERLADLGQLPFLGLGAAAAFVFTRRAGLGAGAGALAACAFALVPIAALQVGTQANDLAGSALLMAAVAAAAAPPREWDAGRAGLVGAALGLAAVTKLALLPGVAVVGAMALWAAVFGGGGLENRRRLGWVLAAAFTVVVAPWWIRNIVREGNPIFPQALPLLGHGVDLGNFSAGDRTFVPRPALWPLYPLIEPIDERSGFGPLFAITLLPGLFAARRWARSWPFALLLAAALVSLPFWWVYTLHEPRFLLPYVGLAAVLAPFALLAVRARARHAAAGVLGIAAVAALILALDQTIVPLARQPVDRSSFYDRVWGVDPAAMSLPEHVPLLLVTGYGVPRLDYAATYPLMGPTAVRRLVELNADVIGGSRAVVLAHLRAARIHYAYVTAVPEHRMEVERIFTRPPFRLVHASAIVAAEHLGARRQVFRSAAVGGVADVARYLVEID